MSLFALILLLIVAGVALYYIPMDGRLKTVIIVVLALVACAWLMGYFGLWGYLQSSGGTHRIR